METLNSQIIDLEQRRLERRPQVVRLAPELDGHGALLNIGFGPSELIPHPVLAWALNEDDSCVGMILHCGTLTPVTQFSTRFQGYTDPELNQLSRTPPPFVRLGLCAARDHFDATHPIQCPDMAELSAAFLTGDEWMFKRLQMWHVKQGEIVPMVDVEQRGNDGPRSVRVDARRFQGFAGLVRSEQASQLRAGAPIQYDFFGLLARYRN